jgi:hypothetical protein
MSQPIKEYGHGARPASGLPWKILMRPMRPPRWFLLLPVLTGGEGLLPNTELAESSPHPQRIFDAL